MTTVIQVESIEIAETPGLDPITVHWRNWEPGRGSITILCYDMAWTAWFGAMSGNTIQQFVSRCDTDYLVTKLVYAQFLKSTPAHKKYLARIVEAIKSELKVNL